MALPKHPSLQPISKGWRKCCCQHALEEHKVIARRFEGEYGKASLDQEWSKEYALRWRRSHSSGHCKVKGCICVMFIEVYEDDNPNELFEIMLKWARHCSL